MDSDISKLKKRLLSEFHDVFKKDLWPEDRLNIELVKVQMVDNPSTPYNCMIAIKIPNHLQSAAKEELSRLLKSGCLELVSHQTKWCCQAFLVQTISGKGEELKTRLATDLKKQNPNFL